MPATLDRSQFAPPPPPGMLRAIALAVLAHLLLMAALTWGISWNKDPVTLSAEAELWSRLPQEAAPKPVETLPPPPPPQPAPTPVPPPPPVAAVKPPPPAPPEPALREAEIALEREKEKEKKEKQAEARRKQLALEKKREEEREREQELAAKKKREAAQELAAKRKQEEARKKQELAKTRAAEAKQKEKEEAAKTQQLAEEAKRAEAQRQANLERMKGLAGATGAPSATGTALRASGPSSSYAGRIVARVRPNIVFGEDFEGNPRAEVEVKTSPDGTIVGQRIVKSSGLKSWDEAVLKALIKTETLPRDTDGRVPPSLIIEFRPKN